ncbi:MAG: cytochrome bc complex cytochrome b subunit [Candidatus Eremiobacteraeota bacterium]|nr:cytochrome bc complex cytochrome b subunit [Candidatus Eremiobacteraeota bacterium]
MIARFLDWIDDRLGTAHFVSSALRKAFPDHWSFMLGEINMYAFLLLIATGTFLALFFEPSAARTTYNGPYALLDGATVSRAFASAMRLSFEVNGGLLIRQVHHWIALIFIAGIVLHMGRVFFTGAFRKPREINWIIGLALFMLAMFAGFTGYSLPDDLVSGTGLRIADSILLSVPIVGSWASFLLLNGSFPSESTIPRLFVAHVYVVPLAIATLMTLHLAIVWRQKHTQFAGPGRTEMNVVGSPLFPQYAVKSFALLFAVAAAGFALGALVQINPVWVWGPYVPWQVVNPVQPDWYVGWLDGALRIGPAFALHMFGHTVPSAFWPAVLMPAVLFTVLLLWPWIEARLRHDRDAHHVLNRPRDVPLRTAFGVAILAFALDVTLAGSGDVQARYLHEPINVITRFYQIGAVAGPFAAFLITLAVANDLRRRGGVHQAPRVRLRRNERGGFDEETIA